jgi:hypothetical protein
MGGPSLRLTHTAASSDQIRVSGFRRSLPTDGMIVLQICHAHLLPQHI